jgi:hypothetical protein
VTEELLRGIEARVNSAWRLQVNDDVYVSEGFLADIRVLVAEVRKKNGESEAQRAGIEALTAEISAIAASAEAEEIPSRKQITLTVTFDQGAMMLVGPQLVESHLLQLYERVKAGYEQRVVASRKTEAPVANEHGGPL